MLQVLVRSALVHWGRSWAPLVYTVVALLQLSKHGRCWSGMPWCTEAATRGTAMVRNVLQVLVRSALGHWGCSWAPLV